jgi:two-component system alkaline phosphatase synthesis response regulator PhoP
MIKEDGLRAEKREKGGKMERILAVDDDPLVTKLVKINLELNDYIVDEAWDGDSAVKILEKNPPDLLVLDLMMPRMDGWDILKMVRENEALKDLPIILLTAKVHDEDLIRGWEMGADDYITKPFNPIRLSDHVKVVLASTPEERRAKRRRELVKLTGVSRADASEGA